MTMWVKRIVYTALAAYLLSFWVEPIVGSTTFDVNWPFLFLLLVPMFASLLPWYGFIAVVVLNFFTILYVYHGSILDWFGLWLEDLSGVLSGALPEEAIFLLGRFAKSVTKSNKSDAKIASSIFPSPS